MKTLSYIVFLTIALFLGTTTKMLGQTVAQNNLATAISENTLSVLDDDLLFIEEADPSSPLGNRKPLLLVHGWNFGEKPSPPSYGTWNNFLAYYNTSEELKANFKPYLVRYWSNAISIKEISAIMVKKMEAIGLNNKRMVILAHSMGGLVSRSFMIDQSFTSGISAGKKCGEMVDLIVTLSSPHHGSPMANGPARDAKFSFLYKLIVPTLETFVFSDTKYNEQNRQDMHWDNYENLLDYSKYSTEANTWLTNMNSNTSFDNKMVCYSASVTGSSKIPTNGNVRESYALGSYIMQGTFGFSNDGIVPISSSRFEGHTVKRIREFKEYNHADIFQGKTDQEELMGPIKTDLLEAAPVRLIWPSNPSLVFRYADNFAIQWEAPSSVSKLNLLFSTDGGKTYEPIAENIDASLQSFSWDVPSANSDNCLIKIVDANNPLQTDSTDYPFAVYHVRATQIAPQSYPYLAVGKQQNIQWMVEGPAQRARVYFSDLASGEYVVLSGGMDIKPGLNSLSWLPADTVRSTDRGIIMVQLFDIDPKYNDNETYSFTSDILTMLGKSEITLLSPTTLPVDENGLLGEKLVVGTNYKIEWKTEGFVNIVQLFLCDSTKTIIKNIGVKTTTDGLQKTGSFDWVVEPYLGNKFYFMAKAGTTADLLTAESISNNYFRVNYQPVIKTPAQNSVNVPLLPTIETQPITKASRYEWALESSSVRSQLPSWVYSSTSNKMTVPNNIQNELNSATEYTLTCTAFFGDQPSYPSQTRFTSESTKPYAFPIVSPTKGAQTELKSVELSWKRSVGATAYKVLVYQKGKLMEEASLQKEDTTYLLNISGFEILEPISWSVTATNSIGTTKTESSFSRKNKTSIDEIASNTVLQAYPNPFVGDVNFVVNVPFTDKELLCQLEIFDTQGRQVASLVNSMLPQGNHSFTWKPDNEALQIKKGTYIARFTYGNERQYIKLIKK